MSAAYYSGSTPHTENVVFDVCIIGAGPAALSVLSAVQDPEGYLSTESQWKQYRTQKKLGCGGKRTVHSVCVIDPAGSWLSEWRGRFASLEIDMLRSPAWATPDYFSKKALIEFALRHGRQDELHEMYMPKKAETLSRVAGEGRYHAPGSALFLDFCDYLLTTLPHTIFPGTAQNVVKRKDGAYDVVLGGSESQRVSARNVVFALGAAGAPRIPTSLSSIRNRRNPRVIHTYEWSSLLSASFENECVVIIGGGLSAAQAALLAVRRGAKRVIHCTRKPVKSRHYDIPIEWMDSKAGWRVAKRDKKNRVGGGKFRLFEFYETPKDEREAWVRNARGGATVPDRYVKELESAARDSLLERWVDEVEIARESDGCGSRIQLSFCKSSENVTADRIILATGSTLDVNNISLLRSVVDQFDLPLVGSLPDLDEDLHWGEEKFTVVGAFALLQVGPDAGNLSGCRRSAAICSDNFGSLEKCLGQAGGPLMNTYSVLYGSDSESESESEIDDTRELRTESDSSCELDCCAK